VTNDDIGSPVGAMALKSSMIESRRLRPTAGQVQASTKSVACTPASSQLARSRVPRSVRSFAAARFMAAIPHRRFHHERCRHGIVITIPADAEMRSRSCWNQVHVPLESA
jgi:hypothetical protein